MSIPHTGFGPGVVAIPHLSYPQRIDNDMHMNVAVVVMAVQVGAYKSLVAGEMLGAKPLAQCLRPVYGQTVVRAVPWVKADDIVVAFHIRCV